MACQKYLVEITLPDSVDSSEILESLQAFVCEISEDLVDEDTLVDLENLVSIQAVDEDSVNPAES